MITSADAIITSLESEISASHFIEGGVIYKFCKALGGFLTIDKMVVEGAPIKGRPDKDAHLFAPIREEDVKPAAGAGFSTPRP